MSVNGTLVEDTMRTFKGECSQFSFTKCLIYTHGGASAKSITNSHETENSAGSGDHLEGSAAYTVKKLFDVPVPGRDVTYQTLPGRK